MTLPTTNGMPPRAWLRSSVGPSRWWRRCEVCGMPLLWDESACSGRLYAPGAYMEGPTGLIRHPQSKPPVQLYATETEGERNLTAMRSAGVRLLTSPVYMADHGWREPRWCYALDNGAFTYWRKSIPFDDEAFLRAVDVAGVAADWIALPDVVAGGLRSLELSLRWVEQLQGVSTPMLLPVQDGMTLEVVREALVEHQLAGVFVGGSTEWKRSTMRAWAHLAGELELHLHVGRLNGARVIRELGACADEAGLPAGAVSCDGTSLTRFSVNAPKLERASKAGPQQLLGFQTTPPSFLPSTAGGPDA